MSIETVISIGAALFGVMATALTAVMWVGQQKATVAAHGRELSELKRRLDEQSQLSGLVARLDERLAAVVRQLEAQPQTVAAAVGAGVREALGVVLRNAPRAA